MAVFQLNEELWFPNPQLGEKDGLVAIGGDLSQNRLLLAYANGFFPWFSFKQKKEPWWYCPLERFVIFPNEIHVSHSMRQMMNKECYEVTFNQDFNAVINACSKADGRNKMSGAWLGPQIIQAYTQLFEHQFAASVEVWLVSQDKKRNKHKQLVGGLYGVTLCHVFFGESMFSVVPSASKLALIHLANRLNQLNWHFIDCQFETPHLKSMGGRHIDYEQYMAYITPHCN